MPGKYEFTEMSGSRTDSDMKKETGCFVRTATGFVLALLGIAIAIGVGLIVHFAENRKLECIYPEGTGGNANNAGSQQGQSPTPITKHEDLTTMTTMTSLMTSSEAPPQGDGRLPGTMIPMEYRIRIQPDMYGDDPKHFSFSGRVEILINCSAPTNTVTLHARKINITSIVFSQTSGVSTSPKYVSHDEDKGREFLIIQLDRETTAGNTYTLAIDYTGPLTEDLQGFYLTTYKQDGQTVYAGVTQFEPLDARKAFPCFDEPAMKATFTLTLVRKKYQMSLSNMPVARSIEIENDFVEDKYDTSVRMSTYLLAFVIGQFENTTQVTANNITYSAWTRPQLKDQIHLALDVGTKILAFYETYFGIKFPLPKQDMIALPDFSAGAMENWGLITYRESYMLYDKRESSAAVKQDVTMVVTHEVSHEWFGDLVTMAWWDDIWLNEGFARYMQYMGAGHLYPKWKMMDQFVVKAMHDVFDVDALKTSHPVYIPVSDPDDINQVFDAISYAKGASVIKMVKFVLGDETFRKGLNKYLTKLKYKNAYHNDLWEAWSEQASVDNHAINVTEIMNPWILQMNYPVVMVTRNVGSIKIEQKRFLKNEQSSEPDSYTSKYGYKWDIPFTYTDRSSQQFNKTYNDIVWLTEETKDIPAASLSDEDWIIGNLNQEGYYRVNYEDSNWEALIKQLNNKHSVIPTVNRAQIINDAWSLSRAGQLSTKLALQTLEYLSTELDYVPWVAATRQIKYVDDMLAKTGVYGSFKEFIQSIVAEPFQHYGLDDSNTDHYDSLTRYAVAELACFYGLDSCTVAAENMYQQWMEHPDSNPIGPNVRSAVYCSAIATGGIEEWEFLLDQFKRTTVKSNTRLLLSALACTRSPWILSRYLELTLDSSVIRKQDVVYALSYIADNPVGELLVWDFVRDRWDFLFGEFGRGLLSFSRLIDALTKSFNTELHLEQLQTIGREHPDLGTGSRAFTQAIENTQSNQKWLLRNRQVISDWLSSVGEVSKSRVTDVRLPRHLKPTFYELTLNPDLYSDDPSAFMFEGTVRITMSAEEAGNNVTLHVHTLNITEKSIRFGCTDGQQAPSYKDRSSDKVRQFEIFYLTGSIEKGQEYFIEMSFTGPLTGSLEGLYLSQYKRNNQTVYIATTQFESTAARKAFPCFDEPALKAKFNVTLIRKLHMTSISNMPIVQNKTMDGNYIADTYQTTKNMSTYLLAFIVCDFEYKESKTKRNVTYRAWARPEYINQTDVALETGIEIITFYEDYFAIPFPLPKQGMIAIPDFSAGAMENWGLITYRETAMLYEPGVSSQGNLQRVKIVVSHELAHQWFGDLVTMDWWDDLWLNEGFASFVEYMGVDHVSPDYKMFEQFVFELYDVFDIDGKVTSHPIYVPVYNPDEIDEIFDTISYGKGACVIRMMRFFLGDTTFQKGLQIYLSNRQFTNADHNDLWEALQTQAHTDGKDIDVKGVLDTWILQMNFPVVNITRTASGHIQLKQDRFLTNKDAKDPGLYNSTFNYVWKIPITYTTGDNINFNQTDKDIHWLEDTTQVISDRSTGWIVGNVQQFGIYRVTYDSDNWDNLINQLKTNHTVIHPINRGQIINDAFGLAKANLLPMETALRTVEYLEAEEEYVPWTAAGGELGYIDDMIIDTLIYGQFQGFMIEKVTPLFTRLTLNNSGADHITSYLRSSIVSKACWYGLDECVQQSRDLFDEYMKNPDVNSVDPAVKSAVYCTAVKYGDREEWEFMYNLYLTATVQAEKVRLLSALGCTRKIWLLKRLINLALNESIVRSQDTYKVFYSVGDNPVGKFVAWDFFTANWDHLVKANAYALPSIIRGTTSSFNTEAQLQKLKDFRKTHPNLGRGTSAFARAIEGTENNILWMKNNYSKLGDWLSNRS